MKLFGKETGATGIAVQGLAKFLAVAIILSVALFGDIIYIVEMQRIFPAGLLLAFCYLGAVAGFASMGYLLLGKVVTFKPGTQLVVAWIVFVVELGIIALNIMLVFSGDDKGIMGAWAYVSPITPVFHMLGVALIYFMDPELKEKHADMEMAAKVRKAQRAVELAQELSKIELSKRHTEFTIRELGNALNSPESLARIEEHARSMNDQLLTELTGRALPPPASRPKTGPVTGPVSEGRYGSRY